MKKIQLTLKEIAVFIGMADLYKMISSPKIERQLALFALKQQNSTLKEEDCFLNVSDEDKEEFLGNLTEMEDLFIEDESQALIKKIKKALA
jgi:hypothetical protein